MGWRNFHFEILLNTVPGGGGGGGGGGEASGWEWPGPVSGKEGYNGGRGGKKSGGGGWGGKAGWGGCENGIAWQGPGFSSNVSGPVSACSGEHRSPGFPMTFVTQGIFYCSGPFLGQFGLFYGIYVLCFVCVFWWVQGFFVWRPKIFVSAP